MHLLLIIISFFLSQSVFSDTSLERQCVEQLCGKFQDSPIYFMPEEKLESFLDIVQV